MKNDRQRGEVVIEATIVVTVVAIFLTIIFYVGMLLYQQTSLTAAANKTASSIAMLYSNNQKDPFTGYVDSNGVYQNITYSEIKTDTYIRELEEKAGVFTSYSLKKSDLLNTGKPNINIDIVDKKGEILKNQIVVTVSNEFNAPLVGLLINDTDLTFNSVGRADCVDLLDYINGVDAISNPQESNILTFPEVDSCIVTFVDNPDTQKVVAVVPVLKGHSISSAESIKDAHSFWPDNPKIKGIKFKGWIDTNGRTFSRLSAVNSDMTVYGSWDCAVTFKPNGGRGGDIVKTVPYGKTVTFPVVSRAGYSFNGWYANKEGTGNAYYSNTTIFKNSCTLYAKWACQHKYANGNTKMQFTQKVQKLCREVGGAAASYELYKCVDCGYEKKNTIRNKHYIDPNYLVNTHEFLATSPQMDDFTAQCNVNHLTGATIGITGTYEGGFQSGTTVKALYHITCAYCGMPSPKVWWDNVNGKHIYQHIWWTSNSNNRHHTECQDPNYRK